MPRLLTTFCLEVLEFDCVSRELLPTIDALLATAQQHCGQQPSQQPQQQQQQRQQEQRSQPPPQQQQPQPQQQQQQQQQQGIGPGNRVSCSPCGAACPSPQELQAAQVPHQAALLPPHQGAREAALFLEFYQDSSRGAGHKRELVERWTLRYCPDDDYNADGAVSGRDSDGPLSHTYAPDGAVEKKSGGDATVRKKGPDAAGKGSNVPPELVRWTASSPYSLSYSSSSSSVSSSSSTSSSLSAKPAQERSQQEQGQRPSFQSVGHVGCRGSMAQHGNGVMMSEGDARAQEADAQGAASLRVALWLRSIYCMTRLLPAYRRGRERLLSFAAMVGTAGALSFHGACTDNSLPATRVISLGGVALPDGGSLHMSVEYMPIECVLPHGEELADDAEPLASVTEARASFVGEEAAQPSEAAQVVAIAQPSLGERDASTGRFESSTEAPTPRWDANNAAPALASDPHHHRDSHAVAVTEGVAGRTGADASISRPVPCAAFASGGPGMRRVASTATLGALARGLAFVTEGDDFPSADGMSRRHSVSALSFASTSVEAWMGDSTFASGGDTWAAAANVQASQGGASTLSSAELSSATSAGPREGSSCSSSMCFSSAAVPIMPRGSGSGSTNAQSRLGAARLASISSLAGNRGADASALSPHAGGVTTAHTGGALPMSPYPMMGMAAAGAAKAAMDAEAAEAVVAAAALVSRLSIDTVGNTSNAGSDEDQRTDDELVGEMDGVAGKGEGDKQADKAAATSSSSQDQSIRGSALSAIKPALSPGKPALPPRTTAGSSVASLEEPAKSAAWPSQAPQAVGASLCPFLAPVGSHTGMVGSVPLAPMASGWAPRSHLSGAVDVFAANSGLSRSSSSSLVPVATGGSHRGSHLAAPCTTMGGLQRTLSAAAVSDNNDKDGGGAAQRIGAGGDGSGAASRSGEGLAAAGVGGRPFGSAVIAAPRGNKVSTWGACEASAVHAMPHARGSSSSSPSSCLSSTTMSMMSPAPDIPGACVGGPSSSSGFGAIAAALSQGNAGSCVGAPTPTSPSSGASALLSPSSTVSSPVTNRASLPMAIRSAASSTPRSASLSHVAASGSSNALAADVADASNVAVAMPTAAVSHAVPIAKGTPGGLRGAGSLGGAAACSNPALAYGQGHGLYATSRLPPVPPPMAAPCESPVMASRTKPLPALYAGAGVGGDVASPWGAKSGPSGPSPCVGNQGSSGAVGSLADADMVTFLGGGRSPPSPTRFAAGVGAGTTGAAPSPARVSFAPASSHDYSLRHDGLKTHCGLGLQASSSGGHHAPGSSMALHRPPSSTCNALLSVSHHPAAPRRRLHRLSRSSSSSSCELDSQPEIHESARWAAGLTQHMSSASSSSTRGGHDDGSGRSLWASAERDEGYSDHRGLLFPGDTGEDGNGTLPGGHAPFWSRDGGNDGGQVPHAACMRDGCHGEHERLGGHCDYSDQDHLRRQRAVSWSAASPSPRPWGPLPRPGPRRPLVGGFEESLMVGGWATSRAGSRTISGFLATLAVTGGDICPKQRRLPFHACSVNSGTWPLMYWATISLVTPESKRNDANAISRTAAGQGSSTADGDPASPPSGTGTGESLGGQSGRNDGDFGDLGAGGESPGSFSYGSSLRRYSRSLGNNGGNPAWSPDGSSPPNGSSSSWKDQLMRVPFAGQIQLVLSNPEGTPVHSFLCRYDLTDMSAGQKTFVRQRVLACPRAGSAPGRKDGPDGSSGKALRYALHVSFVCLGGSSSSSSRRSSSGRSSTGQSRRNSSSQDTPGEANPGGDTWRPATSKGPVPAPPPVPRTSLGGHEGPDGPDDNGDTLLEGADDSMESLRGDGVEDDQAPSMSVLSSSVPVSGARASAGRPNVRSGGKKRLYISSGLRVVFPQQRTDEHDENYIVSYCYPENPRYFDCAHPGAV
eukprot:jgi/Mesvir1/12480/Mv10240-RA.1